MAVFENLVHINFILVFVEGFLSFFSPCVIPILPLYMSYLAGSTTQKKEDGTIKINRRRVFVYTIFFILGICSTFFLLALSATVMGQFFDRFRFWLQLIGGIIVVLFGAMQLGFFKPKLLLQERKLKLPFLKKEMNIGLSFLMGFTFSFAWTPCVGPALSSVLILASSSTSALTGNLLILLYGIGFVIPFICLGLFTAEVLGLLKKHQKVLVNLIKIGGLLLIIIGMNLIVSASDSQKHKQQITENYLNTSVSSFRHDFTLKSLSGEEYRLSALKGKVVFLNFLDIHCIPCKKEIPALTETYQHYAKNHENVIVLAIANIGNQSSDVAELKDYVKKHKIKFPVLLDYHGTVSSRYGITSFPTTYLIDQSGEVYGYMAGELTTELMQKMIEQTMQQ